MPFQPGNTHGNRWQPGESGNPNGQVRGNVHISTMIQGFLNEDVDPDEMNPRDMDKRRLRALVRVAYDKSKAGDQRWADWLAKYGYGQKLELDQNIKGSITVGTASEELASKFSEFLKGNNT